MNLIIDVGNTFVKFAVFESDEIIYKTSFKLQFFLDELKHTLDSYKQIGFCIISSVGRLNKEQVEVLKNQINVLELNADTRLPFINLYKTPKTLGVDRIGLVAAAVNSFPEHNVLIIDAGTCVTYDMLTSNNDYLGGAISPGIQTRYASLNNLTANLPLLKRKAPKNIIGNTTKKAIHSGVVFGLIHEIGGVIDAYKQEFADLTVILTGGDAKFLSKQLKSSIFANSNFLLEGLNYILQFNIKE
jgi:type III pantothenate kinase